MAADEVTDASRNGGADGGEGGTVAGNNFNHRTGEEQPSLLSIEEQ